MSGELPFMKPINDILFKKVTGQKVNFVQDNQSTSSLGVLRGMHYQVGTMAQAKASKSYRRKNFRCRCRYEKRI